MAMTKIDGRETSIYVEIEYLAYKTFSLKENRGVTTIHGYDSNNF